VDVSIDVSAEEIEPTDTAGRKLKATEDQKGASRMRSLFLSGANWDMRSRGLGLFVGLAIFGSLLLSPILTASAAPATFDPTQLSCAAAPHTLTDENSRVAGQGELPPGYLALFPQQVCQAGETKMEDCNTCRCVNGAWACTRRMCPP
jgi:hypothetical protein